MGELTLTRFLSARRERRRQLARRQIRGDLTSVEKRKGLKWQPDDNAQGRKGIGSGPCLPEDIMRHIHALMPLQDAARAACISHTFLQSWRCYPILIFNLKALGLDEITITRDDLSRHFINKVKHILQNHTGIGVKTLKLQLLHCRTVDLCCLDNWLHIAVTPGIEELTLELPHSSMGRYSFPCSLLFDRGGDSVQCLHLNVCTFRPTVGLVCLRRLTQLHLHFVRISGDELELFLSKSFALECLRIAYCSEIIRVTIPSLLQRLNSLQVITCNRLRAIECHAPNLSTCHIEGPLVHISFVKNLELLCTYQENIVSYARTKLLSMCPSVEALTIHSRSEIENTPMVPGKFLHLKYLHICFDGLGFLSFSPTYDYLSLVSFFDASPLLETFILSVSQRVMKHSSVFEEHFHPRRMPENRHEKLKTVKISGFCSATSMMELTYHILENAPSLECLTLDTTGGAARCYLSRSIRCNMMCTDIAEAHRALLAVRIYLMGKAPPALELNIVEPCAQCHAVKSGI